MKKIILFFLIIVPVHAFASVSLKEIMDNYNFSYLTIEDGLPNNYIDDVFKDSKGFLWLATSNGLSRYDGYEFKHYNATSSAIPLKSNFIKKVCEDNYNRLWIASEGGIDILDLQVNRISTLDIPEEMEDKEYSHVFKDHLGNIWVISQEDIYKITFMHSGQVLKIISLNTKQKEDGYHISAIEQIDGEIWIGYNHTINKVIDNGTELILAPILTTEIFDKNTSIIHCMMQIEKEVWIGTNRGLYRYNLQSKLHHRYRYDISDPKSLSQSFITGLKVNESGEIIIATLKGLNFYNAEEDNFVRLMQTKNSIDKGLNCNFINSLLIDNETIWIGTEIGGLNKMTRQNLILQTYVHDKDYPESLSDNPVNAILEDSKGNLWVGNVEGGLNLKLKNSDNFIHFRNSKSNPYSISHNSVSTLIEDNNNRLWVGTWGMGVNVISLENPSASTRFTCYNTEQNNGLRNNFIASMCYDPINNGAWIGTMDGLHFFDFYKNRLDYVPLSASKFYNNTMASMCIDQKARLWIGTAKGLLIIDLLSFAKSHSDFTHYFRRYKLDDMSSQRVEKINYVYTDSQGVVWLGSHGHGLYRLVSDKDNKFVFESYTIKDGLPNNNIFGILEDNDHNLWLSTDYGLSCLNTTTKTFRNFTVTDGILDNQFYWSAIHKSDLDGTMYFGNLAGLIAIHGIRNSNKQDTTRVVLTKLTILNEVIHQGGNQYLNKDIVNAKKMELHESDKSFSIDFSALNYNNTKTVKYAYRLKGFDDHWTETDGVQHFANYTNLNSGKYVFQVKVLSTHEHDQNELTELFITIKPFFYKTWWFYSIMIMIVIISASTFYLWRIATLEKQKKILTLKVQSRTRDLENKTVELFNQNVILTDQYEKINQQKEQLVKMSKKIQEVTDDKIAFFTNITHEFRTPITLITGPIERAINLSYNPEVLEQLHIVDRNSKSLLSLVNQLLDFRKVETNHIEIKKKPGNIIHLIEEVLLPFEAFATERNLSIHKFYRLTEYCYLFDEEWIRKVLVNLLSNAIKFTPNGGQIKLYVGNISQEGQIKEKLHICVNDSGIGIPERDIDKIFNRFYQSDEPVKHSFYGQSGTGIGLYLCERIIKQHGGSISVKNNKKQGSSFRVMLHLTKCTEPTPIQALPLAMDIQPESQLHEKQENKDKLSILLVEDNADMRKYIRSILYKQYNILEAENGLKALHLLAENNTIDFIISDIMMPVMDGVEFSKRVKENIATSHLPILMLTAKTSGEMRMESYKVGVDEYIVKPFDEKLLLIRIENILKARQKHQKLFKINMDPTVLNIDEESKDKKFMDKVMYIMAENYSNSEFEVPSLSSEMGMSKTLLNLKLQELTGQSIAKFIRTYRLNVAQKLILTNRTTKNMNISEIAYEVGFNDPKYFTRVFYSHFGVSPSVLMGRNGE